VRKDTGNTYWLQYCDDCIQLAFQLRCVCVVACRYLAELAKFRLAPPSAVLLRLKALLDDFSGPAVDAAATLVENAGRFLLRLPGK
jgi:hypothetical protein